MWNCKECCKCFRQSPKNDTWGYACDEAHEQGFKDVFVVYWQDRDDNRPSHWGPFTPGTISVYSTLCEYCKGITVKEYFELVSGFVARHDYRFHGGAGGQSILSRSKSDIGDLFSYNYCCGICRREVSENKKFNFPFDIGWISVKGILFCHYCREKATIKETLLLADEAEKEWHEAMNRKYRYAN